MSDVISILIAIPTWTEFEAKQIFAGGEGQLGGEGFVWRRANGDF